MLHWKQISGRKSISNNSNNNNNNNDYYSYNPDEMEAFCQIQAPFLFDEVYGFVLKAKKKN